MSDSAKETLKMSFWVSPFQLRNELITTLEQSGYQRWESQDPGEDPSDQNVLLLIYDPPDQLLATALESEAEAAPALTDLQQGYSKLLSWHQESEGTLLAAWQLQALGEEDLCQWLRASETNQELKVSLNGELPVPDPLRASVTLALIDTAPDLLENYLTLDQQGQRFGREVDSHYLQRLREASHQGDLLLQALVRPEQQGQKPETSKTLSSKLKQSQEEAELTLMQLHQVQEELEHYFLRSRSQDELLRKHTEQQRRAEKLIASLLNSAHGSDRLTKK